MKHKHIVSLFSSILLPYTLCFVSCNPVQPEPEPEPTTEETAKEYIFHRTFSIMAIGEKIDQPGWASVVWGTAWVISDVTKDINDDYEYWIATNWHVIDGQNQVCAETKPGTFGYYYGCSDSSEGLALTDYQPFSKYEIEDEENFTFDKNLEHAIDFYVVKVNFGKPQGQPKANLDYLNFYNNEKGYITKTFQVDNEKEYLDVESYVAGYPVNSNNKAVWKYNELFDNYLTHWPKDIPGNIHEIVEDKVYDVAPTYNFANDYHVPLDWLPEGSSGSMLIGKIEGEWQVVAIYWGGIADMWLKQFQPFFSIFNSIDKNFVEPYI